MPPAAVGPVVPTNGVDVSRDGHGTIYRAGGDDRGADLKSGDDERRPRDRRTSDTAPGLVTSPVAVAGPAVESDRARPAVCGAGCRLICVPGCQAAVLGADAASRERGRAGPTLVLMAGLAGPETWAGAVARNCCASAAAARST